MWLYRFSKELWRNISKQILDPKRFFPLIYIILLIMYNYYPFYTYEGAPINRYIPVKDLFSFKLLFINYCFFLTIMLFIQYIYTVLYVFKRYSIRIKRLSMIYRFFLMAYVVVVLSPALIYWGYGIGHIIVKNYLSEEEIFSIAHGYLVAIVMGIVVMYLAPLIAYILLSPVLRHIGKYKFYSIIRMFLLAILLIPIQIIALNIMSLVEGLVNALLINLLGYHSFMIYLHEWNPIVLELAENNPNETILLIPTWGGLIALTIYWLIMTRTYIFLLRHTIK